jgi:glutamate synthase domain-containing protein 3
VKESRFKKMAGVKTSYKSKTNSKIHSIDSERLNYRDLNLMVRDLLTDSECSDQIQVIVLKNVLGQRYIGDGIKAKAKIKIYGTPGNDLAAFMDGPEIEIFGNGQDGVGNTMNSGKIIIHGDCGDILGYSMRGGQIYTKGNVGYRSGIHMKSYLEKVPAIIIGGKAGNFLGEYMAGGIIIVLGINETNNKNNQINTRQPIVGDYVGTGMHGGTIYIRGEVEDYKLGREVNKSSINITDREILKKYIFKFFDYFKFSNGEISNIDLKEFIKLTPHSHRPYGNLYAY